MTIEERVKILERQVKLLWILPALLIGTMIAVQIFSIPAIGQSSARIPALPIIRAAGIEIITGQGQIHIGELGQEGLGLQIRNKVEGADRPGKLGKNIKPEGMALLVVHDTGPAMVLQDKRAEGSKIVANIASGQPGMYIIDNYSRVLWKTMPQKITLDNPLPADTVGE